MKKIDIEDLETKIINNKNEDLFKIMDPLFLWMEEFKKSFANIFWNSNWKDIISIQMDKFEKKWIK